MDPPRNDSLDDPEFLDRAYEEMRALARRRLARAGGYSLQATELVNETWLRLVGRNREWTDRSELLNLAGRAMRDILVERARRRGAQKRGGDWQRVNWESAVMVAEEHPEELLTLDAALSRLSEQAADHAKVVIIDLSGRPRLSHYSADGSSPSCS